jgi:hypothetical protein
MNRRGKILIVVGTLLAVGILVPIIRHYQLRAATEAYIAQLKAKGEPMDLAQVVPGPVPPAKNAAPLITNALAQIYSENNYTNSMIFNNPPYAMNRAIPGREMIGWRQPVIHGPDTWPRNLTNTWDELGEQLAQRQNDLNDLRRLIERPTLDFHLDYSDIRSLGLMAHLPQLKTAVQWLEASEYYNLHRNQTADACVDVRAMLALINGESRERYEISQLLRLALAHIIAGATWDILQIPNVTEEDLAQLQRDWQSLQLIAPVRNAFLFERVNELHLLDNFRQSPTNLSWWLGSFLMGKGYDYEKVGEGTSARWVLVDKSAPLKKLTNKISIPWDEARWRWFWSYRDELQALQTWDVVLEGIQELETNHSFIAVQSFVNINFARLNVDSIKKDPFEIASQTAFSQLAAIRKAAGAEVARNIVITAIALKRYEIRNHRLPDKLDEMVPGFLKSVPIDFMNGQPLRYRPNTDGTFLLYSVGENGVDDGGNPSFKLEPGTIYSSFPWQSPHALDWVWPQPATPEEIQNFYEHSHK